MAKASMGSRNRTARLRGRGWMAAPFAALAVLFTAGAVMGTAGCSGGDDRAPPVPFDSPGATAYTDSIHCKVDADCQAAESCTNGVCQMKRCADNGLVKSAPPLGA